MVSLLREAEKHIIGLTIEEANRQMIGCDIRVIEADGKRHGYTEDLRTNRINVATEKGKITKVLFIG